jgi:hypothetical protein
LGRIHLVDSGGASHPRPGEEVIAHVDAFLDEDEADLEALDRQFGDWLRDGTVVVDLPSMEFLDGRENSVLRRVLSSPDLPATGLAETIRRWFTWGVVEVPDQQREELDRWAELQVRSRMEDVTILLTPPADPTVEQASTYSCPT